MPRFKNLNDITEIEKRNRVPPSPSPCGRWWDIEECVPVSEVNFACSQEHMYLVFGGLKQDILVYGYERDKVLAEVFYRSIFYRLSGIPMALEDVIICSEVHMRAARAKLKDDFYAMFLAT